jgi:HlyD family secretion protein
MSDVQGLAADARTRTFRDAALERLNSPEQLDQRIRVIPPAMRLLAASTAVIILAALAWAVFGSVPTRVFGRGVLVADKEGNYAIAPISSGLVLEMLVKTGDRVRAGAPIASIEQKLLSAQIENAVAQVNRLEANFAQLKSANAVQIRQSDETAIHQQSAINEQVAAIEVRREQLRQLIGGYGGLRAKLGTMSRNEMISLQEQYDQTALDLANAKAKKAEIEAIAQKKRDDLAEIERQKQAEIDLQKADVDQLRLQMRVGSVVEAPISGVIREIRVGRGDVVTAGEVLATIGQDHGGNTEVLTLLQGDMRKRVAVGMEAHIVPDGIKKEEYGSMRGRVASVSDGDVSSEHVNQILRNPLLTTSLVGDAAPLLAWIELAPAKQNPSGFAWWSGTGPPYKITIGSVVTVDIVVERVRPISLVIPALRKLLSLEG